MFGRKRGGTATGSPARSVPLVRSAEPKLSLRKAQAGGHVDLVKKAEVTGAALERRGLGGITADVVAVLDYSGSMRSAYSSGAVQTITERALALGLQVDPDGQVPVILFGSDAEQATTATLENYQGVVDREVRRDRHGNARPMGTTNLTAALRMVLAMAKKAPAPLFVFVVTDGRPDDARSAEAVLAELSHYPVFVKILATTANAWSWLEMLDDALPGRLIDGIDAKFIGDPAGMPDLPFAEALADEWDSWTSAALGAGILTGA